MDRPKSNQNSSVAVPSTRKLFREVLSLLTFREKIRILALILLNFFTMILEILSVGLVLPVSAVVVSDTARSSLPLVGDVFTGWSEQAILISAMMVLLAAFVGKNAAMIFSTYIRSRVLLSLNARLTTSLFIKFLAQPYVFHLRTNSAELVQAIQNIPVIASGSLLPALLMMADVLVAIGVIGLMVVVEPVGSLVTILLFGTVGMWLTVSAKSRLAYWGNDARIAKTGMMQALLQAFGGIKEIKILGRSSAFVKSHQQFLHAALRSQLHYSTFSTIPRSFFEVQAVLGLVVLVTLMAFQGRPSAEILPVLALFAAGSFRILPSITRIVDSVSQIRYASAIVDQLRSYLQLPENRRDLVVNTFNGGFEGLKLENAMFQYTAESPFVLGPVSFAVAKGEFIGLVGESGSGKSTLVDLISGLIDPSEGAIFVNGFPIAAVSKSWQSMLGYVPQTIFLTDDSIRNNVALGIPIEKIDENRVRASIEAAKLMDFCLSLPDGLDTPVGERGVRLSGGQRQRIGIARALYHEPEVLLLDEATSSLDMDTEREVMTAVNALKGRKTVIIIAHRLSTVENCDRLYRLASGKLVHTGTFLEVSQRMATE